MRLQRKTVTPVPFTDDDKRAMVWTLVRLFAILAVVVLASHFGLI